METVGITKNYLREANNPRLQCPRCAKWKRLLNKHGEELFENVDETKCEWQTLCKKCVKEIGL